MRHKTVNPTNVRTALRRSWDTQRYEDVNDEWSASIEFRQNVGVRAHLWSAETGEEFHTPWYILWDSMTDLMRTATSRLLSKYHTVHKEVA